MTIIHDEPPAPTSTGVPTWWRWLALAALLLSAGLAIALFGFDRSEDSTPGGRLAGSGNVVVEAREVSGFDAVSLFTEGRVVITQGEQEALTIETDDNLLPYLDTEVRSGTLTLAPTDDANNLDLDPSDGIIYRVELASLSELSLIGAGTMEMDSLETDELELVLTGAGDIRVESLEADELVSRILGAGSITAAGQVEVQDVSLLGAGDYRGSDLRSSRATVTIPGTGRVELWVTGDLDVTVAGHGDVAYYGRPTVSQTVVGSGNVTGLGDK